MSMPRRLPFYRRRAPRAAFTLVEMLVACALLVIVLLVVFSVASEVATVWKASNSRVQTFQDSRSSFEAMSRRLAQATLNTYYDYYQLTNGSYILRTPANSASFTPTTYDRVSDLHFICGQAKTLLAGSLTPITTQTEAVFFQAPIGYSVTYGKMENALNACGYFLQFSDGSASLPSYITNMPGYTPRYRYRLMEMLQPTENLGVYVGPQNDWYATNAATCSRVMAENVIALVLLPKLAPSQDTSGTAVSPNYNYNSRIPLGATSDTNWASANPAFPADSFTATDWTGTNIVTMTRHNQLPPLLHVVMIVLDEDSAKRLQGSSTTVPTAINFANTSLFTDATKLTNDIQTVEDICNAKPGNLTGNTLHLNYRIFTSDIGLNDSKWSNN